MGQKLRFRPNAPVQDYQRQDAGTKAFLGYRIGVVAKGPAADGSLDRHGFIPSGEIVEVDTETCPAIYLSEYARAAADGDLDAVDAATAAFCSQYGRVVKFVAHADEPTKGAAKPPPSSAPAK